jgi:PIN domain nuclease of toxin-antitoxin system
MRYLLDTHTFIWFTEASTNLSPTATSILLDAQNDCLISIVSLWELAIKLSTGKLRIARTFENIIEENIADSGFTVLPVTPIHCQQILSLPFHHRDPFDRMLAAQSIAEKIPLLSIDPIFDSYASERIW